MLVISLSALKCCARARVGMQFSLEVSYMSTFSVICSLILYNISMFLCVLCQKPDCTKRACRGDILIRPVSVVFGKVAKFISSYLQGC